MKRLLLLCTLTALLTAACSSIDCPVQNTVYTVYLVPDTLKDTLTIWTRRSDGTDTVLLNRGVGLTTYNLPISYFQPEDTLFYLIADTAGVATIDTVWLKKDDVPHFESVDCNAAFFHTLTDVRHTMHGIDSIVIYNRNVNYDPSNEHFHIYFKGRNEK